MSVTVEEIVSSERVTEMAMSLTPPEQSLLLARLHENLESLERDPEHEAAWVSEIKRRVLEVENGEAELIDHDVVMKQIDELLAQK